MHSVATRKTIGSIPSVASKHIHQMPQDLTGLMQRIRPSARVRKRVGTPVNGPYTVIWYANDNCCASIYIENIMFYVRLVCLFFTR